MPRVDKDGEPEVCIECGIDLTWDEVQALKQRVAELESIVAKLYAPDPGLTNDEMQIVGGILGRLIKGGE